MQKLEQWYGGRPDITAGPSVKVGFKDKSITLEVQDEDHNEWKTTVLSTLEVLNIIFTVTIKVDPPFYNHPHQVSEKEATNPTLTSELHPRLLQFHWTGTERPESLKKYMYLKGTSDDTPLTLEIAIPELGTEGPSLSSTGRSSNYYEIYYDCYTSVHQQVLLPRRLPLEVRFHDSSITITIHNQFCGKK